MDPVVAYVDEGSTFVSWLHSETLEVIHQTWIPVIQPGSFIKSIGCENFDMASDISKLLKCHTIYAVSCTDNNIHVYTQVQNTIRYYGAYYIGRVT
jgi:hypothetical protein